MAVSYTPQAQQDLVAIGDWIAEGDPRRALTFVAEIRARVETLAQWPDRFPQVRADRGGAVVRRLNHRRYRIFYRVRAGDVEVLAVHHGARAGPDLP